MSEKKHSKLPWKMKQKTKTRQIPIWSDINWVGSVDAYSDGGAGEANAELIVKAVNSYASDQQELERLRGRDCNATIELCYDNGINPFAREDLQVVDVGVSDNCYVVESKVLSDAQQLIADLVAGLEKIVEECEGGTGENAVWAGELAKMALENAKALIEKAKQ